MARPGVSTCCIARAADRLGTEPVVTADQLAPPRGERAGEGGGEGEEAWSGVGNAAEAGVSEEMKRCD